MVLELQKSPKVRMCMLVPMKKVLNINKTQNIQGFMIDNDETYFYKNRYHPQYLYQIHLVKHTQ